MKHSSATFLLVSCSLLAFTACTAEEQAATEILVGDESSSAPEAMENEAPENGAMMEASSSSLEEVSDTMMQSESVVENNVHISTTTEVMVQEDEPAASGQYAVYSDGVIGNGQTSVLFFHAAWCPVCREEDKQLVSWYTSQAFPLTVHKVDYDSSLELRKRYGVTYQHTFVKIDGQGNMITKLQGPTDSELQALLGA